MPRPAGISPDLLQTFVTIVQTGGDATVAAEILNINQPSMSKRLAFLQHSGRILKRPWIERIGKSWHLTNEGKRVLPAVQELVHRYRILTDAIDTPRPNVALGCNADDATGLVQETLTHLLKAKTFTFSISTLTPTDTIVGVANGSLDIGIVRNPEVEVLELARRPLCVVDLYEDPLVMVSALDSTIHHEFVAEKNFTPKSLTKFPLLLPSTGENDREEFNRRCREAGVYDQLRIAVEASPASTLLDYAAAGYGVALVPESMVDDRFAKKALPGKLSHLRITRAICRKIAGTDDLDLKEISEEVWKALQSR